MDRTDKKLQLLLFAGEHFAELIALPLSTVQMSGLRLALSTPSIDTMNGFQERIRAAYIGTSMEEDFQADYELAQSSVSGLLRKLFAELTRPRIPKLSAFAPNVTAAAVFKVVFNFGSLAELKTIFSILPEQNRELLGALKAARKNKARRKNKEPLHPDHKACALTWVGSTLPLWLMGDVAGRECLHHLTGILAATSPSSFSQTARRLNLSRFSVPPIQQVKIDEKGNITDFEISKKLPEDVRESLESFRARWISDHSG